MSTAQESLKTVGENIQGNEVNLVFNEVLFGITAKQFSIILQLKSIRYN